MTPSRDDHAVARRTTPPPESAPVSHEEHIRTVFDASYRVLVAQMHGICGDLVEAEDAVSEAFVRALARPEAFEKLHNPEAWLRTVAVNLLRSRWRRLKRHRRAVQRLSSDETHTPALSPAHVALVDALRALPTAQREVVVMHHLGDLPVAEIAETLDISPNTVKTRLARGRRSLAGLLGDDSMEVDRERP